MGCPIREPADQRLLTAPRGLSQPSAPFIGPRRQGIHRAPVVAQQPCSRTTPSRQDRLTSTTLHLSTYPRPHEPRPNHPPPPRRMPRANPASASLQPNKNGPTPVEPHIRAHARPTLPALLLRRAVPPNGRLSRAPIFRAPAYLSITRALAVKGIPRALRWRWADSNPRPPACKAGALPLSYIPMLSAQPRGARGDLVGQPGIEPGTSVLSGLRSNRLSYWPGAGGAAAAGGAATGRAGWRGTVTAEG